MNRLFLVVVTFLFFRPDNGHAQKPYVLNTDQLQHYVEHFNSIDEEAVKNYIPNAQSFAWLSENIPLFNCPDSAIQKIYYFRWWAFRKHLKKTPNGYVFTEFIQPVGHGGKYNAISSALGHQIYEGRWLHNPEYIDKYISFWLYEDKETDKPRFHAFSSWIDNAVYNRYLINLDKSILRENFTALVEDYKQWEEEKKLPNNMFWQYDVRDAMEESISGSRTKKNIRPTINSYMYGNAKALSRMAEILGEKELSSEYAAKAAELKKLVHEQLWDEKDSFFKVQYEDGGLCDAREAIGFIPWYFNLPKDEAKYAVQWEQLKDTAGFNAPWGLTTAERRHPLFRTHGSGHGCEWDGAIWPYATTQTLKALSNLLTNYKHKNSMTNQVFYDELHKYAMSHVRNGKEYLGEYQDEKNGTWLKMGNPRSHFYNHSGFADLIINDLVGLKPSESNKLEIHPLLPQDQWDWFCLDNVKYHGKTITVLWDKTGQKYGKGKGFRVFADGKLLKSSKKLKPIKVNLN